MTTEEIFNPPNSDVNTIGYIESINICQFHLYDDTIDTITKGLAIHKIMSMETINAVNKKTLRTILRWLGYSSTVDMRRMKKDELVAKIREMWCEVFEWEGEKE